MISAFSAPYHMSVGLEMPMNGDPLAPLPFDAEANFSDDEVGYLRTAILGSQPANDDFWEGNKSPSAVCEPSPSPGDEYKATSDDEGRRDYPENCRLMCRDVDVCMGRGRKAYRHPGNQLFYKEASSLQKAYRKATTRKEKRRISQVLVDTMHAHGAEFLQHETQCGVYVVVDNHTARLKASQCLRELKSEEDQDITV